MGWGIRATKQEKRKWREIRGRSRGKPGESSLEKSAYEISRAAQLQPGKKIIHLASPCTAFT